MLDLGGGNKNPCLELRYLKGKRLNPLIKGQQTLRS